MINGKFHHVAVSTPDLDRAVDFYCRVLGGDVVDRYDWARGNDQADRIVGMRDSAARSAMVELGPVKIELFEYASPSGRPMDPDRSQADHGLIHFSFEVGDIHATYGHLVRAGMEFLSEPVHIEGMGWSVYGRDIDGNVIELQSP